jgi:hypothetical protein
MSPGAQNIKTVLDALGTTEDESEVRKTRKRDPVLYIAENESGSAKHENRTGRPRYRRKRVQVGKS